ncbi:glycosyltransferase family 1 protein [bacterium]|nr:glycosyltransferase family 1 protein [bacterium]
MKRRWLEWTLVDPRSIIGGVETHLLSMAACLEKQGYEVCFSSDPEVLFAGADSLGEFDVIRTHGAALPKRYLSRVKKSKRVFRIHTLHGSSLGMMQGLGEWFRFTHLKAFYREWCGCFSANLVASIHPGLVLYQLFFKLGRAVVIWNGWDARNYRSKTDATELQQTVPDASGTWAFVGRLWDRQKAADRVGALLDVLPTLKITAVPGDGMDAHPRVLKTGRLGPDQVAQVMTTSEGLLLPSRYEGLSLVLLEALSLGIPVLATRVGGHGFLSELGIQGLDWLEKPDSPEAFARQVSMSQQKYSKEEKERRAIHNRSRLWTWERSTQLLLAVMPGRSS